MVVCSFRKTITRQAWRSQRDDSSKNREPKQDGCRDWGIDQRDGRLDNSMEPRPGPWTSAVWAKGDQEATEDLEELSLCLAGMANPSGRFRVASSRLIGLFSFVCRDFCVTGPSAPTSTYEWPIMFLLTMETRTAGFMELSAASLPGKQGNNAKEKKVRYSINMMYIR